MAKTGWRCAHPALYCPQIISFFILFICENLHDLWIQNAIEVLLSAANECESTQIVAIGSSLLNVLDPIFRPQMNDKNAKALYGFQTGRIFCANSPSQQARGDSHNLLFLLEKTACSVIGQSATDRRPLRSVWNP